MKLKKLMSMARKTGIFCFMVIAFGVMAYEASAAELPPGTVITKDNFDRIKNDTFEGKTIASMTTGTWLEWQIKNWGLQIKLRHSEPFPTDPRYVEATKKYAGTVKFDPKTREVTGYQAGLAFPNVSMDDPYAGDKLAWNAYYGMSVYGYIQYVPHFHVMISGNSGLERVQKWFWLRYWMKGRLDKFAKGISPVEGDGSILTKTLLFLTHPYDIRGIGVFVIRWDTPQMEDQWAYVKSVRRTRRLSGGAWMDPVGATDLLSDDIACWNGRPSWYPKIKLLGKRWILAIAHTSHDWNAAKKGTLEEFPAIDLATWPHWNPSPKTRAWEPREVWVVEGTTPSYHPYSKRVVYEDVNAPILYFAECYDKAGKPWKLVHYTYVAMKAMDGFTVITTPVGHYIDFKRLHSSVHYAAGWGPPGGWQSNNTTITANDVTLGQLEAAGK